VRVIEAWAPTRICDIGGWTDTWFAGHGSVVNLAVTPAVEVRLEARSDGGDAPPVAIDVENEGRPVPGPHPLLEAAVGHVGVPAGTAVRVAVRSDAPLGASTGTSAAVVVALVGALDALAGGGRSAAEVAAEAHRVEVERLRLQSGVQDQLCAATGGICAIEVTDYPAATVTRLDVDDDVRADLDRRLLLVFLGPHRSSPTHERVIAELARRDDADTPLPALRVLARRAREALCTGDLDAFGAVMRENTALQAELAPGIVSAAAEAVIDVARRLGALGWKVNGAGGEGGSVTLLGDGDPSALAEAVRTLGPPARLVPVALSPSGLRVS
jgi:D-glycero-alpha-D-manno-heptose-7-phosphate kinase